MIAHATFFKFFHWLGFTGSLLVLGGMAYFHGELHSGLLSLHSNDQVSGNYLGWLLSLGFASVLPAISGWLVGRIINRKQSFLPFR
jgi:hypothetical protein